MLDSELKILYFLANIYSLYISIGNESYDCFIFYFHEICPFLNNKIYIKNQKILQLYFDILI